MRIPYIKYVQGRNAYSQTPKYGIAIHNTSNDASAVNEASYATRRTDGVSAHFYADNVTVIQSIDTVNRTGHAGSSTGNNNAVSVEITGVNGWSRNQWITNVNWELLGRVLADVCRYYGVAVRRASVSEMQSNPRVKAFYSHDDMRRAWGGTDHTDPGGNFPWDVLFSYVNKYLGTDGDDDMTPRESEQNANADVYLWKLVSMNDVIDGLTSNGAPTTVDNKLGKTLKRIENDIADLKSRPANEANVDATEVARALAADQDFLNAIAKAVADETYRRQAQ